MQPADGYCDDPADAQTVIDMRGALVGVERRRFSAVVMDMIWPTIASGLPQVHLIDSEQGADLVCLVARMELDLEAETTTYELFG